MQETIINWQGFEAWTPQWDVFIALGTAVLFVWVAVRLMKSEADE